MTVHQCISDMVKYTDAMIENADAYYIGGMPTHLFYEKLSRNAERAHIEIAF